MELIFSESVPWGDKDGSEPAQRRLNSKARRHHKDQGSNQVGDCENKGADWISCDRPKNGGDTSPEGRCHQAVPLDCENTKRVLEALAKESQKEAPAASQTQQGLSWHGVAKSDQNTVPDSTTMLTEGNVVQFDASKEGNVYISLIIAVAWISWNRIEACSFSIPLWVSRELHAGTHPGAILDPLI